MRKKIKTAVAAAVIATAGAVGFVVPAHAAVAPSAVTAQANTPIAYGVTSRDAANHVVLQIRSNRRYVSTTFYANNKKFIRYFATGPNGRVTYLLPRTTTRLWVRVTPLPSQAGTGWRATKVPALRKPTPSPTPTPTATPRLVVLDTCEKVDAFIAQYQDSDFSQARLDWYRHRVVDPLDIRLTIDYAKTCQRGAPNNTGDPVVTLGTPRIVASQVVPLDATAPDGWTIDQVRQVYGVDKKGWLVTVEYPVRGEQWSLDLDQWFWSYSTNPGSPPRGTQTHWGTHQWSMSKAYSPADVGDTLTLTTQVPNSATSVNGGWTWTSPDAQGKQYPVFNAQAVTATQQVNIGSPAAGWSSTVRMTKFVPEMGSVNNQNVFDGTVDLNASIDIQATNGATAAHGANYLPSTVTAQTLGYDPDRATEQQPGLDINGNLTPNPTLHASVGGQEKTATMSLTDFQTACAAVATLSSVKPK